MPTSFDIQPAEPSDLQDVEQLLTQPVDQVVRMTMEYRPDLRLAEGIEADRYDRVVVRRGGSGEAIGTGSRLVRDVFLDGEKRTCGYLAQLRKISELKVGRKVFVECYRKLMALRMPEECPFDLTSIMADNALYIKAMERGLRDMPRYHRIGELITVVISTAGGWPGASRMGGFEEIPPQSTAELSEFLIEQQRRFDFASVWSESALEQLFEKGGLGMDDFVSIGQAGQRLAVAAVWDQSPFKQITFHRYPALLKYTRPLVNLFLRATGRVPYPRLRRPIPFAFLSHIAVADDAPAIFASLLRRAKMLAKRRGLKYLVFGIPKGHPFLGLFEDTSRAYTMQSNLYLVTEHQEPLPEQARPKRIVYPEVALL
jgi:hypothetical protein